MQIELTMTTTFFVAFAAVLCQPATPDRPAVVPSPAQPAAPATPTTPTAPAAPKADKPAEPAKDAAPKLEITIDVSETPDMKEWAEKAKTICIDQWPKILEDLKTEGFKPTESVLFVFKKDLRVPAYTSGTTITVNAKHVASNRDDFGMMVHELVHVAQSYPRHKENLGWLVEGIADYERFWKYEPKTRQGKINTEKASYKDAYRTTAAFLGFVALKYDKDIVTKLNARMRKSDAAEAMFKDLLGKSAADLWKEFVEAGAPSSPQKQQEWHEAEKKKADEKKDAETKDAEPKK